MDVRRRLERLERWRKRYQPPAPKALRDMTDAELYAVVAAGTSTTVEQLAAMSDAQLMAFAKRKRR
jgi:hypothetical protein